MVKWRELSDEQIVAAVRRMVDESRGSKEVAGYFLTDEPGAGEFPALAKAVAAVKQLAPGKLAYINLFPSDGTPEQLGTASYTEYLERYVAEVRPQFLCYDNYQVHWSEDQENRALSATFYTNLVEVRRVALKHGLPFWQIVCSNQLRPGMVVPSPANLLLQAYTTLAAGASGVTWYTYFAGGYHYAAVDKSGHPTATWAYLKMVNDQLRVLGPMLRTMKSTGVYFATPGPDPSLPTLPGKVIEAIASESPAMVGEFTSEKDDGRYAMVVNLSLERSAKLALTFPVPKGSPTVISPVDGSLKPLSSLGDGNSIWLAPGQGALIKAK
jgi:hypothetical protein